MTTYAISDLHLRHANIIEYCDRPFDSVEEMNEELYERWNSTVSSDDIVYFLGDLAMTGDSDEFRELGEQLNGEILMTAGNHDEAVPDTPPFPIVESFVAQHGKYRCHCTHRPSNVPEEWSHWALTGHHHNNDLRSNPFIDTKQNVLNLSVELIEYTPIALDDLFGLVDAVSRSSKQVAATVADARAVAGRN